MKPDDLIKQMTSIIDALYDGDPSSKKIQKNLALGVMALAEMVKDQQGHIDRVSKMASQAMVRNATTKSDGSNPFGGLF